MRSTSRYNWSTEGWLKGSHDGLGIVATTLLVVLLQSLHCHDLSD
ncbi:unnamed protein product [Brassica oleracea var. botrytis]|uniref:Uncharacterized protein n=2 Tax=Brassica TaxID=3705 RepID=A0A3P6CFV0_BRAOL|nr:unnamed protein product [Brassica napus]CAF1934396.1 unnamed protein product [Brassica napus]CDY55070.1 BnaCnng28220D [Brassica napus]VDD08701.1 unnamed protein product [Brassica oleracea]